MSAQFLKIFAGAGLWLLCSDVQAQNSMVSPSAGLACVQIKGSKLLPGCYGGLEMGRDRLKVAVELHATFGKTAAGDRSMEAASLTGQQAIQVPVHVQTGYTALLFGARYYLVPQYQAPGNGFFVDAGLAVRKFLYELEKGAYDASAYSISAEVLDQNSGYKPERSYGIAAGLGYQHNFESQLSVNARLGFDTDVSGRSSLRPRVMTMSAGIRYNLITRKGK